MSSKISNESYTRGLTARHNLLPPAIVDQSRDGITVTTSGSGSITISGTATADEFYANERIALDAGTYILSGGSAALVDGIGLIGIYKSGVIDVQLHGDGEVEFTLNSNQKDLIFRIVIFKGARFNTPITIRPMIRYATDTDTSFRSYMNPRNFKCYTDPTSGKYYDRAGLIVESAVSTTMSGTNVCPSIGFHNPGINAATVYLGTDNKLYFVSSSGTKYQISMTLVT